MPPKKRAVQEAEAEAPTSTAAESSPQKHGFITSEAESSAMGAAREATNGGRVTRSAKKVKFEEGLKGGMSSEEEETPRKKAKGSGKGPAKEKSPQKTKSPEAKSPAAKGKAAAKAAATGKAAAKAVENIKTAGKGLAKRSKTGAEQAEEEDEEGHDGRSYWLMKAEPESRLEKGVDVKFSIDDLMAKDKPEAWDGVRNPTARNNMRSMRKGDYAFFYHSNCKIPGVVGVMEIVEEHSTDESAFDENHPYFDPKSNRDNPKWCVVHVEFRKKFDELVKLKELQHYANPGGVLEGMQVLKLSRLSVSKVRKKEWDFICQLAGINPATLASKGEKPGSENGEPAD